MSDLEARVQRLEEQLAKLGFGGPGGVIRTSALEIVDSAGQTKGEFALDRYGAGFYLKDTAGQVRASLSIGENGPELQLRRPDGLLAASVAVPNNGEPQIQLRDATGQSRVILEVNSTASGLQVLDGNGIPRLMAVADNNDGVPYIALSNAAGLVRTTLAAGDENSGLRVYDSHEQGRLLATVDADERPMIALHDSHQVPRVKITQMPDESPMLSLCDTAGKMQLMLISKDGLSGYYLYDSEHRVRAILSTGNPPSLIFLDENKQPIATFPPNEGD